MAAYPQLHSGRRKPLIFYPDFALTIALLSELTCWLRLVISFWLGHWQRAHIRVVQHAIRITQVCEDDADAIMAGQQITSLLADHRVIVCIHNPAARVHQVHHLVGVAHGRQPRPDIDELADPALGNPPGRPLMESSVGPGAVREFWHECRDPLGSLTI